MDKPGILLFLQRWGTCLDNTESELINRVSDNWGSTVPYMHGTLSNKHTVTCISLTTPQNNKILEIIAVPLALCNLNHVFLTKF